MCKVVMSTGPVCFTFPLVPMRFESENGLEIFNYVFE